MRDTPATIEIDTEILDKLPARCDRRVEFIWHSITELKQELEAMDGGLIVRHGRARELYKSVSRKQ